LEFRLRAAAPLPQKLQLFLRVNAELLTIGDNESKIIDIAKSAA
jgi:hypothetical protein